MYIVPVVLQSRTTGTRHRREEWIVRIATMFAAAALCTGCSATDDGIAGGPEAGVSGTLFVANKRGASLSRVDLATGEETHRAQTCENPHELTVSPDEALVLVACYSGTSVQAFRTGDLQHANTLGLGDNARVHSAMWLDDGRIIAGAEGRGSLMEIVPASDDGFAMTEIGGGGDGPHMVAVNGARDMAWGTIIPSGTVIRYDLENDSEAVRRVVGNEIEALALSPDGKTVWVGSNSDAMVYRLDAQTLETVAQIPVGPVPIRIAAHPSGEFVATSNFGTGDISVIDTSSNEVVRTIAVSGSQDAVQVTLVFSEDGSRLYAAETARDTIAEVDFASGEVLRRLPIGPGGDGLAVID